MFDITQTDASADAATAPAAPSPEVQAAAAMVAAAEAQLAETQAVHADAVAAAQYVKARGDALAIRHRAIVARRASGDQEPSDGAELAEIAADVEGLADLLQEATERVKIALSGHEARMVHYRNTALALERIVNGENQGRLIAHADALDALLLRTLEELDATNAKLGQSRVVWAPSQALEDGLRRLSMSGVVTAARHH